MSGDKPEDQDKPEASKAAAIANSNSGVEPTPSVVIKPKSDDGKAASKKAKGGGGGWVFLALLLALAAAGLSGWMYWQDYQKQGQENAALRDVNASIGSLRQQQQALMTGLTSQREAMAQLRSEQRIEVANMLKRSQELESTLQSMTTVDRQDWLLAEAEYLLRLANQRLQLGSDAKNAGRLLASADLILRDIDDTALHSVRAAIAEEIASLQSVAEFDVEGLYLALQGVSTEAEKLTLYRAPSYQAEAVPEVEEDDWQNRFRGGLLRAWHKLRSYIRVRHHEQSFKPTLAPEQEAALRHSLRLMIEQAQMALLAERPELYGLSLDKAEQWLLKYYQLDEHTKAVAAQIPPLRDSFSTRQSADISASLRGLKKYVESRRWQQEVGR